MSFRDLSTELDGLIVGFLEGDHASMSAFSQVSKYYRFITEPLLYRDVTFNTGQDAPRAFRLLLTLLDRRELAQHIRSFNAPGLACDCGSHNDSQLRKRFYKDFQAHIPDIQARIQELYGVLSASVEDRIDFLSNMFCNRLCNRLCIGFGCALVIFLASNIERIELSNSALVPTSINGVLWAMVQLCPGAEFETTESHKWTMFPKLRSLRIGPNPRPGRINVPIPPEISILRVEHCYVPEWKLCPRFSDVPQKLRHLFLFNVHIRGRSLENSIRTGRLQGIELIAMEHIIFSDETLEDTLLEAMGSHLPKLRQLEWTHPGLVPILSRPTYFDKLENVHKLVVDASILLGITYGEGDLRKIRQLGNLAKLLPPRLKSLHLEFLPYTVLHETLPVLRDVLRSVTELSITLYKDENNSNEQAWNLTETDIERLNNELHFINFPSSHTGVGVTLQVYREVETLRSHIYTEDFYMEPVPYWGTDRAKSLASLYSGRA